MTISWCPGGRNDGPWEYDISTKMLHHNKLGKCLTVHPDTRWVIAKKNSTLREKILQHNYVSITEAPPIYIDKSRAMEMLFCFKKYSVGENEKQQNSLITFVVRYKHNL